MSCIPDRAVTEKMYELYQTGVPCHGVARAFKVSRQTVWNRFKRRGLEMRPSSRSKALPCIEFDGDRYAPEKDGYFRKTVGDRMTLHHAKYIKVHGPIKRGYVVRFVDGDRMNVDIDNLEMVRKDEAQRRRPIEMKPCLWCGQLMGRRVTGNHSEGPSAYGRRQTCDAACSGKWKRGRPRGIKMVGART